MTWGNPARRRAERFAALVERSSTGERIEVADARDGELLELVGALRSVPDPQPRPEFVVDLRARLLSEAETALAPDDLSRLRLPARHTSRERRLAAVVGGLAIVGATTSVAVASQSALPGESLYPIKRVIESAHVGLSLGEADKGSIQLANAADRLDEASALAGSDDPGAQARVGPTLATFGDQATEGADLLFADYAHHDREASIARLRDFASSSLAQLEQLEPSVPTDARDELIAAADVVAQIDAEATQQCPDCPGTPIEAFPPSLVAAQPIELPAVPAPQQATGSDPRGHDSAKGTRDERAGDDGSQGQGGQDAGADLPSIDGQMPPGSVLDPTLHPSPVASPSRGTNPLKALTDGLAGALTGGPAAPAPSAGPTPGAGTGSTAPTAPLTEVVQGVTEILQGALDPITGTLVPPRQ